LVYNEALPNAVLLAPVVFEKPETQPKYAFWSPVVVIPAWYPNAVLYVPVAALSAW
jgi:hypothetical protein